MKILVLNYEYPPIGGGAGPATRDLCQGFSDKDHQVDVVTMGYDDLPKVEKIDENLTIHRVNCLRSSKSHCSFLEMLSFLPFAFWRSRKLIKQKNYDINHTHFIFPTGTVSYLLDYLYDLPYVVTCHGADVPRFNPDRFTIVHKFLIPLWKSIANKSQTIISPSKYLQNLIKKAGYNSSTSVIPNGFDATKFNEELGDEEIILLGGRLIKRKKFQDFIEALKHVDTDWKILITGEGSYRHDLEKKAENVDNNIEFLGWVDRDKLDQLLDDSQIYVFPTDHANCPVGVQEGMASGNALLTSDKAGAQEMVADSGVTVDVDDHKEFANKLNDLLKKSSKRTKLAKKARKRIEENYSKEKIVQNYLEKFKKHLKS